jgi:hypothetical protein
MMASDVDRCTCGECMSCTGTKDRQVVGDRRVFRHAALKSLMLSRIGSTEVEGLRPLDALGTRDNDDPTIALIDAYAGALHILAWSTARLAEDGSIRKTGDRDALVELVGLLGYEPRPAISATTTLAFEIEAFPGSPATAKVPKGTKVASVPAQDEQPKIFETDAELEARVEWNALLPVLKDDPQEINANTKSIEIVGVDTLAKVGDLVLVYLEPQSQSPGWLVGRIDGVERITNQEPPRIPPDPTDSPDPARTRIDLAPQSVLTAPTNLKGDTFRNVVVILGQRAAAFGATAIDFSLLSKEVREVQLAAASIAQADWPKQTEWPSKVVMKPGGKKVDLDAVYPDAVTGRLVVLISDTKKTLDSIKNVTELARKDYGLSAKVTQIELDSTNLDTDYVNKVRQTAFYLETSRETLLVPKTEEPLPATPTDRIVVQGNVSLPIGRRLVLSGEQWSTKLGEGPEVGEVAILKSSSSTAGGDTQLVFEGGISAKFRSTKLKLLANCAPASHGETPVTPTGQTELLGSASTAALAPRYELKRSPLTYVPAPADPRGYAPEIDVRVGDREYDEASTLHGLTSEDRAYTVRTVRGGASEVQFAGRLPTGTFNVTALYRSGAGKDGNLPARRLTTIMAPVLGVTKVSNPVPAEGASDPETVEALRTAAPQSIRTLDRVVSLADFEAFAKTRPGVGKALATELRVGMRSVVGLTIATTELTSPASESEVVKNLRKALAKVAVPGRSIRIDGFTELSAHVGVALAVDPALRRGDVETAVRERLADAFGWAKREFGAAIFRSSVLAVVQGVEGVIAARLTAFVTPNGPAEDHGRLPAPVPAFVNGKFEKGGLLAIEAANVTFSEMTV